MSHLGLLVMDMQPGLLFPENHSNNEGGILAIDEARDSVERSRQIRNITEVLKAGVQLQIPAVFVEYDGYGPTIDELTNIYATQNGSRSFLVHKDRANSFEKTNLQAVLEGLDLAFLVMMGLNTSSCVLRTMWSARSLRFAVVTSMDLLSNPIGAKHPDTFYRMVPTLKEDYREVIEYLKTFS